MGVGVDGLTRFIFAGQEVYGGHMWYHMVYPDNVTQPPFPPLPYMGGSNKYYFSFVDHGVPFNVLKWFKEYYGGYDKIPRQNTTHYFNDDGECTINDNPTWHMSVIYAFNGAYFSAGSAYRNDPLSIANAQVTRGYLGCDLDNVNDTDIQYANLYFYTPQQEYLPDITNLKVNEHEPLYEITTQYHAFMEGSLVQYDVPNSPVLMADIIESVEQGLTTIYGPDTYFGPSPVLSSWAYIQYGEIVGYDWDYGIPAVLVNDLETFEDDPAKLGEGGGDGYNYPTMEQEFPELPGLGVEDTGFTTMYIPTISQLKDLSKYMWSSSFITSLQKLIAGDPIDAIINLAILPIDLSDERGAATDCIIGNVDTGIQMYPLNHSYKQMYLGYVDINEVPGAAIDYEPYVTIHLFLPFVGFIDIKPSEVVNLKERGYGRLEVNYNVNLFTGEFIATVRAVKQNILYKTNIAHYAGNLSYNIPVSGKNYSNFYKNILSSVVGVVAGAASGGAAVAADAAITGAFSAATTEKPVQRSGSISGSSAIMGYFKPYFIRSMPHIQCDADGYKKLMGFPACAYRKLNTMHGYTECDAVKLDGFNGNEDEAKELEQLLKTGVYLPEAI